LGIGLVGLGLSLFGISGVWHVQHSSVCHLAHTENNAGSVTGLTLTLGRMTD